MRELRIGNVAVRMEAAEAGGRYKAPILIVPGLFQSWICWRGMTAMLAHRGWNVYLVPRIDAPAPQSVRNATAAQAVKPMEKGPATWREALEHVRTVAVSLEERPILFGADVGASLALSAAEEAKALALVLLAPATPGHAGTAYEKSLGFFARRRARGNDGACEPPAAIAKTAHRATDVVPEPDGFVADLASADFHLPAAHPPAIVFAAEGDPLVDRAHSLEFAASELAKPARTTLAGRWWPSSRWEPVTDEAHRFLILTLADRVVEFPDEILED